MAERYICGEESNNFYPHATVTVSLSYAYVSFLSKLSINFTQEIIYVPPPLREVREHEVSLRKYILKEKQVWMEDGSLPL